MLFWNWSVVDPSPNEKPVDTVAVFPGCGPSFFGGSVPSTPHVSPSYCDPRQTQVVTDFPSGERPRNVGANWRSEFTSTLRTTRPLAASHTMIDAVRHLRVPPASPPGPLSSGCKPRTAPTTYRPSGVKAREVTSTAWNGPGVGIGGWIGRPEAGPSRDRQ